jgi:hypothetical protein
MKRSWNWDARTSISTLTLVHNARAQIAMFWVDTTYSRCPPSSVWESLFSETLISRYQNPWGSLLLFVIYVRPAVLGPYSLGRQSKRWMVNWEGLGRTRWPDPRCNPYICRGTEEIRGNLRQHNPRNSGDSEREPPEYMHRGLLLYHTQSV